MERPSAWTVATLRPRTESSVLGLVSKLNSVDQRMVSKLNSVDPRLVSKLHSVDPRLVSKLNSVDPRLVSKLNSVDPRIERRLVSNIVKDLIKSLFQLIAFQIHLTPLQRLPLFIVARVYR